MNVVKFKKLLFSKALMPKLFSKLHYLVPVYYLSNKNIRFEQANAKSFKKLKSRYKSIIDKGIEVKGEQKASNTVWICWFQGEDKAPDLVRACINSVRLNMPDFNVIIITRENIKDYTKIPSYIWEKYENGQISFAHFSDLVRIDLLCEYGGVWIDATVLCTQKIDKNSILNNHLFMFKQLDLIHLDNPNVVASSWLISAYSNQEILLLTRKLLWQYWKDYNYLINYFTFHLFFTLSANRYKEKWAAVPLYNNHTPHVLFFELQSKYNAQRWKVLSTQSPFHKLNYHLDYDIHADNFYNYILNSYL
ncbi:MAG: capsular polysaccharide synthesis protein [Streptococcus orisratti]|uniref:capsular polysaccharide synthesis protein n=1 Tax=Streptococcus orisratti TaxID=114652 RepID=UPI002357EAF4|nr:capsular polysaccharide synthesis protein [Streptococcus orisratti]MCI7678043.1 capsular polysaccharide synthesis protein [Streptococcus orisratti]